MVAKSFQVSELEPVEPYEPNLVLLLTRPARCLSGSIISTGANMDLLHSPPMLAQIFTDRKQQIGIAKSISATFSTQMIDCATRSVRWSQHKKET